MTIERIRRGFGRGTRSGPPCRACGEAATARTDRAGGRNEVISPCVAGCAHPTPAAHAPKSAGGLEGGAPAQTGRSQGMQESHDVRQASRVGPESCVVTREGWARSVDRGVRRPGIEPRNIRLSGGRPHPLRGKATRPSPLWQGGGCSRAVQDPVHAPTDFYAGAGRARARLGEMVPSPR